MRPEIAEQYLLLCEGLQDKVFFKALFAAHNITKFLVECPEKGEEGRGVGAYPAYFNGLVARTRPQLKGLIITRDCDGDSATAFKEIADGLQQKGYKRPSAPLSIEFAQAAPFDFATMVLLIPPGVTSGCLETLLYPAAANKWPTFVPCVDDYWRCIDPTSRPTNEESKIKLRVLLAAAIPDNPNLTLARIWDDPATSLPLTDGSFAPVVAAIRDFCARV